MQKSPQLIQYYQTKIHRIAGTNYAEVKKLAERQYSAIKKKSKRTPYIRSAYFNKEKIFLNYFWDHLKIKSLKVKTSRLKLLPCALDLIKNSKQDPKITVNYDRQEEIFYRFYGKLPDGKIFYVQIKRNIRSNRKYLMSFFPE